MKRLKNATDENKNLRETIERQNQLEAQLESQCKNLRLALSELELKYSHNEQQRTDLERKLKDAEEQNALQFGLLTDSRKNMQAQQLELEVWHASARLKDTEDQLELTEQEKRELQFKIRVLEDKLKCTNELAISDAETASEPQITLAAYKQNPPQSIADELETALTSFTSNHQQMPVRSVLIDVRPLQKQLQICSCTVFSIETPEQVNVASEQFREPSCTQKWFAEHLQDHIVVLVVVTCTILLLSTFLPCSVEFRHIRQEKADCGWTVPRFLNYLLGVRVLQLPGPPPPT
ncbi:unnamed protein product [Mesocestoides corti]|uniref:Uncharacterized protein n=2 Tax=Mesocestoides corti TaxID=53468 RepID=A0A0R3U712_MESCO|nr:unnamed protein product [Mesocestoides corti]